MVNVDTLSIDSYWLSLSRGMIYVSTRLCCENAAVVKPNAEQHQQSRSILFVAWISSWASVVCGIGISAWSHRHAEGRGDNCGLGSPNTINSEGPPWFMTPRSPKNDEHQALSDNTWQVWPAMSSQANTLSNAGEIKIQIFQRFPMGKRSCSSKWHSLAIERTKNWQLNRTGL